jgi:RND family efflux transporter MFP subunit
MPRLLISLCALVLLVALTVLGVRFLLDARPAPARVPPRELGPVPVELRPLEPARVTVEVRGFGTLDALRSSDLAPEVGGRVLTRLEPWAQGRFVEAGTLLVAIDPVLPEAQQREAETALAEARAALHTAEVELRSAEALLPLAREALVLAQREEARLRELSAGSFASESQIDAAARARTAAATALGEVQARAGLAAATGLQRERAIESAQAALGLARERSALCQLRAPFDGHLAGAGPDVGDYLPLGVPCARLVDLSRLRVVLQVREEEFAGLELGQAARVLLGSRPGLEFAGQVVGVGAEADPALRSLPVEVELVGAPREEPGDGASGQGLRAGQFVEVSIVTAVVEAGLVLGRDEFTWRDGAATAFVLVESPAGSLVERRSLKLGPSVRGGFLIESGLRAGEQLIVAPLGRLEGGEPCRARAARSD